MKGESLLELLRKFLRQIQRVALPFETRIPFGSVIIKTKIFSSFLTKIFLESGFYHLISIGSVQFTSLLSLTSDCGDTKRCSVSFTHSRLLCDLIVLNQLLFFSFLFE